MSRRRTGIRLVIVGMAALTCSAILAACGGGNTTEGETQPRAGEGELGIVGSWVGTVSGSDAFVGVNVFENRDVMAYVCDGNTISQWFVLEDAGPESFAGSENGAQIEAEITKDAATGTVTLADGRTLEFEAPRAALDGGLYRAVETIDGEEYVGGWIVLPSGEQRGAVQAGGATINGGTLNTANPVVSVGGASLQGRLVNPFTSRNIDF